MTNRISVVFLAALLLAGCQPAPSIEGRFTALENTLFLQCYGKKGEGPTVLLEHGLGDQASSAAWDKVAPRVAAFAFVCRYDRAGAGQSNPPAQQDRDGTNLTAELYALLDVANIPKPYVLVGHSFGGYPARLFVSAYPQDVVGVIFVDSVHENIGLLQATGAETWSDVPQAQEALDLERIEAAVAQSSFLQDLPVIVLTRGEGRSPAWDTAQQALRELSSNSDQVFAKGSGHEVPLEKPGTVVSAVRDLLKKIAQGQ